MDACRVLNEYSIFINKVKCYKRDDSYKSIKAAVDQAVKECLKDGILVDFLKKHKAEEMAMNFLYEFDAKKQSELDRKDGIEEGRKEERFLIIRGALKKGRSPEQVAEFMDVSLEEIKKVQSEMLEEA